MKKICSFLLPVYAMLFALNANAEIKDCGSGSEAMQNVAMPQAVASLKMQGIKLSPFLLEIDRLYRQPGGSGGKYTSNYQCSIAASDPTPKNPGLVVYLFTPKSSVSVPERTNLPEAVYLAGTFSSSNKNIKCFVTHFIANGVESKEYGYVSYDPTPHAVMSCN